MPGKRANKEGIRRRFWYLLLPKIGRLRSQRKQNFFNRYAMQRQGKLDFVEEAESVGELQGGTIVPPFAFLDISCRFTWKYVLHSSADPNVSGKCGGFLGRDIRNQSSTGPLIYFL
jgi:hypothetical protein